MRILTLLVLSLLGPIVAGPVAQQGPGDHPRMFLAGASGPEVPGPAGPFDNSHVFTATAGEVSQVRVTYQAAAQPNQNVIWALLLSGLSTPFPTNITPPPLFTQPPFELLFPNPLNLDPTGQGTIVLPVPTGLFGVEVYLQAVISDTSFIPSIQLSNGTRMAIDPPDFNVRFTFVRAVPALGTPDLEGTASRVIDGATLKTFPPLGSGMPPTTETDDIGLPAGGFEFLPIVANIPDAPINPLARPMTFISQNVSSTATTLFVEDTSFFPTSGFLYVATGSNLFGPKVGGQQVPPAVEVVAYGSKTRTSFDQVRRKQAGSGGVMDHPHTVGDMVLGEFTMATTSGALTRERIGLDATNIDTPHVVLPPFTFTPSDGEGLSVTMDLDLYRYQANEGNAQGFMVLDRETLTWRLIEGTAIAADGNQFWEPMVAVAPDRRSMLATVRIRGGDLWDSDPDELWAIRLDGESWPATGTEVWQIDFELGPEPTPDDQTVRSRRVHMPSVAIIGPGPDDQVGFVGLAHKVQPSPEGNNNFPNEAVETFWEREEVIVRDYITVPLVAPGSSKPPPPTPRPYITGDFPPLASDGAAITRFDPFPVIAPDQAAMFVVGGLSVAREDIYRLNQVGIDANGEAIVQINNISGSDAPGGDDDGELQVRAFRQGGHGWGGKAAISPGGTRMAFVRDENQNRDFLNVLRTNGADFGQLKNFTLEFTPGTEFGPNHVVTGVHWYDEDTLYFLMGRNPYDEPLLPPSDPEAPAYDVFTYDVPSNTISRVTSTEVPDPGADPEDVRLGSILPAAVFASADNQYYYVVRDGLMPESTPGVPMLAPIMNVVGVHMPTATVLDVTGDEHGGLTLVPNADLPDDENLAPIETVAPMRFVEGGGVNDGFMYFVAHAALDPTFTDELFGFHTRQPIVSFQGTSGAPAGAHVTNVTPNPYSAKVAFVRTFGPDPLATDQHPFVLDLANFLFLRDVTPLQFSGGQAIGRVMDGSLHFIAPSGSAGDALVFSMGGEIVFGSEGIAQRNSSVYYPLANVSDALAEPVPLLLPLLWAQGLGPGYRVYLMHAEAAE